MNIGKTKKKLQSMKRGRNYIKRNVKLIMRARLKKWKLMPSSRCSTARKLLHKTKYAQYIGDGDSKTFKGILDAQPYKNFVIRKKECIDHIQKRMGTRLRALKKSTKGLGGKGKLTNKLIDELTIYYGLAIRQNHDSIEKMKETIWAKLFHTISTDDNPQHDRCPVGETSWCSWQKAKALNKLADYKHKPPKDQTVFNAIKPVYEDLSSDHLLSRCLGGYTHCQNNNESFNSVMWSIAPNIFQRQIDNRYRNWYRRMHV